MAPAEGFILASVSRAGLYRMLGLATTAVRMINAGAFVGW